MKSPLESFHVSALDDAESSSTYGGFFVAPILAGAYLTLMLKETVDNPKGIVEGFLDAFH